MVNTINLVEIQIKEFVESIRPPVDIREKVDIGYKFQQNTLELFEIRPKWDNQNEKIQSSFAKTRYVKTQEHWKIYWMRASGKWESYQPNSEVKTINDFFEVISEDKHGCFFG